MEKLPIELEVGWRDVEAGITRLLRLLHGVDRRSFSIEEYMQLYSTVHDLCHSPREYKEQLHERYKKTLEDYTKSILSSLKEKHGVCLLKELVVVWKNHKILVSWLSKFFAPLDQCYIQPKQLMPVRELGFSCFYDIVFNEFKTTLSTLLLEMVRDERDGEVIDGGLVKHVLDIYVEIGRGSLGLYKLYFEQAFCKGTADYYSVKAQTWILEDSCSQYMLKAEECLQKEKERVAHYLHASTVPKVLEATMFELITRRAEQILYKENSGCKLLLLNGKTEDLSRMYRLFSQMEDGLSQLSKILKEHLNEELALLLNDVADAANSRKDFVQKAIELHHKQLSYVKNCFENHTVFQKVLKVEFELFWCKDAVGCGGAESLASFIDDILKKGGNENLDFEAIEETLDKVVYMLRYICDKDVFFEFLRKKLGKRLLVDKSDSYLHDLSLISKLQLDLDHGWKYTNQMSRMIFEMLAEREHQKNKFEKYIRDHEELNPGVDFNALVLTRGLWPSYKTFDLKLPSEMKKCVDAFEVYYKSKKSHIKLNWIYSLGDCNIVGYFEKKPIELILNTYQAAVLLLFNETDQLSCSEIVTQLNLPKDMVVAVLKSLACGKYKILDKEPSNNQTISGMDTFQFNHTFTHKMQSIKVPLPRVEEKETLVDDVKENRRYSIDACLVRIMKTRKTMSHKELVEECVAKLTLSFKPEVKDIKNRIDDLIEREYMKRDEDVAYSYKYLA